MRVYILLIFICLTALFTFAQGDDHEVRVVGDKNYNNATLVYDGIDVSNYQKDINWEATASDTVANSGASFSVSSVSSAMVQNGTSSITTATTSRTPANMA